MQSADHRLEISYFILFLFDEDPKSCDLLLHALNLLSILLILLLQLPEEMVGLLLQVLHHQLFLLVGVDDEVVFSTGFQGIRDEVVIIGHRVELELDLFDVLLEGQHHVFELFLGSCFLFEDGEGHSNGHVVWVVIRDEL